MLSNAVVAQVQLGQHSRLAHRRRERPRSAVADVVAAQRQLADGAVGLEGARNGRAAARRKVVIRQVEARKHGVVADGAAHGLEPAVVRVDVEAQLVVLQVQRAYVPI